MSHVLDALNRLERDSRRMRAPDLDTFVCSADAGRRGFPWRVVVALAVAAIGLTLAIGWILYPPRGGQAPAPRVAPGAEVAPPQAPDVDAPPVDAAPGRAMAAPATPSAELSDLRIDGHMVVPQRPELNRVFVAGRAVRLGEALAPGILLLEVQPGIAVVDHRGERHELQIR